MSKNTATRPGAAFATPNRWAVPVFVLGLLTLGGVLATRSLWLRTESCERRELSHLRGQLDKKDADPRAILARAEDLLDGRPLSPELQAQAHLVAGAALIKEARQAPPEKDHDLWGKARAHLDQADKIGVGDDDVPRLRYRQALCAHHTGVKAAEAAALLEASVTSADDPVEGYKLLAELHLKCDPPNLAAALAANEKLRQLPLLGEDVLGPARLQAGELLFLLGRNAEARKTLENVPRSGDPALYARARLLRAESLVNENNWEAAARLWQQSIDDPVKQSPRQREEALYQLGYCYWRLERFDDAAAVWEECAQKGTEGPARAAALRVAELKLNGGEAEEAVAALGRAVQGLASADDWPTSLVPLERARSLFERACEVLGQKGDHVRAVKAAEHYARLAVPGRAMLLRAERAETWGAALAGTGPEAAKQRQTLRIEAGRDYRQAAEQAAGERERCEYLGRAGRSYLLGGDAAQAAQALEVFVGLCKEPAGLGEAWYLLGDARRQLGKTNEAESAYREAIKYPTKYAYRARYRISQLLLAQDNVGDAMDALQQNIKLLRLNPDNEALEQSLYSLAALLYQRHEYSTVPFFLDDALARYPASPHALRGRYQLADSYRQLAAQENVNYVNSRGMAPATREHHWKQHRHWLEKANEQHAELVKILRDNPAGVALTPEEVAQVFFNAADCRFNLGDFAGALAGYEELAQRYRGKVDGIKALGGCVRCHAARNEFDKVQLRVSQIRAGLDLLDETTRRQWEGWLADASKRYVLAE